MSGFFTKASLQNLLPVDTIVEEEVMKNIRAYVGIAVLVVSSLSFAFQHQMHHKPVNDGLTPKSKRKAMAAYTIKAAGKKVRSRALRRRTATKAGWWIRIDTSKTQASKIAFLIGTESNNREPWFTWASGDATEIDVPSGYVNVAELYIGAASSPQGKNSWLCLMYKDRGVKHMDFDDFEDQRKKQSDYDNECN